MILTVESIRVLENGIVNHLKYIIMKIIKKTVVTKTPKAQKGKKVSKKESHPNDDYKNMVDPMTGKKGTMGGEGTRPPFGEKEMAYKKKMTGLPKSKMGNSISKAKNGKPVKKALLGSLLGGAGGGGGGKGMLGGMGKQMLGGMASKALGGLMGGGGKEEDSKKNEAINSVGPQAAAISKRMSSAISKSNMPKKSTDMTTVKTRGMMKKGGKVSKAKNGKSFPDLNKDGKITKADILKGRGVIAKKGMTVKKCKNGCK
jgi:hypothetical protein